MVSACGFLGNLFPHYTIFLFLIIFYKMFNIYLYLDIKCSGDTDGRVPVTSSKRSIQAMNLTVDQPWRSWLNGGEVQLLVKQLTIAYHKT